MSTTRIVAWTALAIALLALTVSVYALYETTQ
jgi:hypothetical protein